MLKKFINKFKKGPVKKAASTLLVLTLAGTMVFPHLVISLNVQAAEGDMTGLKLYWTDIPDNDGEMFYWPRKCYFTGGSGEYTGMSNMYTYCIANHSGQPSMGAEAWVLNEINIDEYMHFQGNDPAENFYLANADELNKFVFCLGAAAAVGPGKQSSKDLQDNYSTTYKYILAQSMFLAIEGRTTDSDNGIYARITEINREHCWEMYVNAMNQEFAVDMEKNIMGKTRQLHESIRSEVIAERRQFFDDCYDAAIVMYNAIQSTETGFAANTMSATVDPNDSSVYIMNAPCFGDQSVYDNYYSKISVTSPAWSIVGNEFDGTNVVIRFKGPAGIDIEESGLTFKFPSTNYLTDLSAPLLYEFDFKDGDTKGGYQVMFCAMKNEPTFSFKPSGGSGDGGGGDDGDGEEGGIELEIHRYKHTENWTSTYNVDLIKLDSETGKPLSGSKWDILEYDTLGEWSDSSSQLGSTYLDHPVEEAGNIGEKYNWANDNGSQFERWDGEDACSRDANVTGEDGYLYEIIFFPALME